MPLSQKEPPEKPDLRAMWLSAELPEGFQDEPVAIVLVDMGMEHGCATVMGAVDGAASLYFSTGGAFIGAGEHPGPAQASRALVALCARATKNMSPVASCPLPRPGHWAFNVRTPSGWRRFVATEDALSDERHPAHHLYAATHELIGQIRLTAG